MSCVGGRLKDAELQEILDALPALKALPSISTMALDDLIMCRQWHSCRNIDAILH